MFTEGWIETLYFSQIQRANKTGNKVKDAPPCLSHRADLEKLQVFLSRKSKGLRLDVLRPDDTANVGWS